MPTALLLRRSWSKRRVSTHIEFFTPANGSHDVAKGVDMMETGDQADVLQLAKTILGALVFFWGEDYSLLPDDSLFCLCRKLDVKSTGGKTRKNMIANISFLPF